jgi:predicted dehydrogenase
MRVGLIGYGCWGKRLAAALDCFQGIELIAIHSRSSIPDNRYTQSFIDILKSSDIDAVVIATPLDTRYHFIESAIVHGKHVLTEKPLSRTCHQSMKLRRMAKEANVSLFVDYVHSYSPTVTEIKEFLQNRKINSLRIGFGQPDGVRSDEGVETLLFSHILAIAHSLSVNISKRTIVNLKYICSSGNMIRVSCDAIDVDMPDLSLWADLAYPDRHRRIEVSGDNYLIIGDLCGECKLKIENFSFHSQHINNEKIILQNKNLDIVFQNFVSSTLGIVSDNADISVEIDCQINNIFTKSFR